jgi:hypothetical protein
VKLLQTIKINQGENLRIKVGKRSNRAVGHNEVRHYPLLSNGVEQQKREYPNGLQKLSSERRSFQER